MFNLWITDDCCIEKPAHQKTKTYFKSESRLCWLLQPGDILYAEKKATKKFNLEMNDEIDGSFDIEEYQPEEDNYL